MVRYAGKKERLMSIILHIEKKRFYRGPDTCLPSKAMQLLNDSPSLALRFLSLHSGDHSTSTQALLVTAEGSPQSYLHSRFLVFGATMPSEAEHTVNQHWKITVEDEPDVFSSTAGLWVQSHTSTTAA